MSQIMISLNQIFGNLPCTSGKHRLLKTVKREHDWAEMVPAVSLIGNTDVGADLSDAIWAVSNCMHHVPSGLFEQYAMWITYTIVQQHGCSLAKEVVGVTDLFEIDGIPELTRENLIVRIRVRMQAMSRDSGNRLPYQMLQYLRICLEKQPTTNGKTAFNTPLVASCDALNVVYNKWHLDDADANNVFEIREDRINALNAERARQLAKLREVLETGVCV